MAARAGCQSSSACSRRQVAGGKRGSFERSKMPPRLTVDYGQAPVTLALETLAHGKANDDARIRDLCIFVGARKVLYQSNPGTDTKSLEFSTEVPLEPGINYVSVFARENQDVVTRQTFVVRRDGEDGALLETPEHDTDAFDESARGVAMLLLGWALIRLIR